MVLILIVLALAGFAFPPAWLALAGYGIYIFASKKTRRDEAIESRVKKMVDSGVAYATFGDLYFQAAHSYAIAKGAQAPEENAASATMIVNGSSYFVTFIKDTGDSTIITITDSASLNEFFIAGERRADRDDAQNITAKKDAPSILTSIVDITPVLRDTIYSVENMSPLFENNKLRNRIRIVNGDLRITVLQSGDYITFCDAYKFNTWSNASNMIKWNSHKKFASYSHQPSGEAGFLKYDMLIANGVPRKAFIEFIDRWAVLITEFYEHCGISASNRTD